MDNISNSSPSLKEIQSAVSARFKWGVKALKHLVSIDSVSPYEKHCQEALATILREEGLPIELIQLDDGGSLSSIDGFVDTGLPLSDRPNLITYFGRNNPGSRSLLLNAHIDTVSWEDQLSKWLYHPLSGEVVDGKLYGRGSMDDKGPLMAGILAILSLRDLGFEPPGKVIFTSVVDEEPGGNGTLALSAQGYLADAAINLEPTDNNVMYGHRGAIGIIYKVTGEARHGSIIDNRTNAIVEAGKLAKILHTAFDEWKHPSDTLYGRPLINIGRIEGGNDIFTSPQECLIKYGIRYAPGTFTEILEHIDQHVRINASNCIDKYNQIESYIFSHYDASETLPDSDFVQSFLSCVQKIEPDRQLRTFPACCDARHLNNRYYIPTLIFGPSLLSLAHAENEYLDLNQWQLSIQELALFISLWCQEEIRKI